MKWEGLRIRKIWLPGSTICRSTDPDPKGKILINNWKKNVLLLKPKSELLKKVGLIKKIWKLFFIKKLSKSLRNDLDLDPDFTVWILRSGSGFASKLNGSLALGKEYPSYPPPPLLWLKYDKNVYKRFQGVGREGEYNLWQAFQTFCF